MSREVNSLVLLVGVAASAAGAYNVMSDNTEVERTAQTEACVYVHEDGCRKHVSTCSFLREDGCTSQKTSMERGPVTQSFEFAVANRKVLVACSRRLYLAGEYACKASEPESIGGIRY